MFCEAGESGPNVISLSSTPLASLSSSSPALRVEPSNDSDVLVLVEECEGDGEEVDGELSPAEFVPIRPFVVA